MTAITFNEHSQYQDDLTILNFMLENGYINEDTQEDFLKSIGSSLSINEAAGAATVAGAATLAIGTLARRALVRFGRTALGRLQLLFWNQYSKRAMANMFGGIAVLAYMIPTAAALATLIAAWFGIPIDVAIQIAKAIFYVGMTVAGAFIALMGRRAALKFINWINKNRIDKDIKKLEKNKKLTKADLANIQKIAKKYNTKKSLNVKDYEKFKKKVA